MGPQLSDTSTEAQRVLAGVYRSMSPARKWGLLGDLYRQGRHLHAVGVRLRRPDASGAEIRFDWLHSHVKDLPRPVLLEESQVDQPIETQSVIREVVAAFQKHGIDHALGGSMASSIHGIARYTADADLTVEPFPGKEEALADHFGPEYYLSLDAIRAAVRERSSFNIIHTNIGFKLDIFIKKTRLFDASLMNRRLRGGVPDPEGAGPPIDLVAAEDIILLKLEWYRLGNETSDRQWTDILGVLRVQGDRLDNAYLDHWAAELKVSDLLDRVRAEARL